MAEDKPKGPDGADEELAGADAASQSAGADDGYTPYAEDVPEPADDFQAYEEPEKDDDHSDEPADDAEVLAMFNGPESTDGSDQLGEAEEFADAATAAAVAEARTQRPAKKTGTSATLVEEKTTAAKKNRPTRTRAEATQSDAPKKTGLTQFVSQVVQELKKVSWPTSSQLMTYFVVVLVFVVFMIAFIGLMDVLFGWLMLKLFS